MVCCMGLVSDELSVVKMGKTLPCRTIRCYGDSQSSCVPSVIVNHLVYAMVIANALVYGMVIANALVYGMVIANDHKYGTVIANDLVHSTVIANDLV
eukprot:1395463-Amorphochlora_amoeboformis.AAC.1